MAIEIISTGERVVVVVNGRSVTIEDYEVLEYKKFSNNTLRFCNKERFADLPFTPSNLTDILIDGQVPASFTELDSMLAAIFPVQSSGSGGGVGSSYLVYTALLTQSGTDAPVATVLENTFGGTLVWSRISVGSYKATLIGAFPNNKTFLLITMNSAESVSGLLMTGGQSVSGGENDVSVYNNLGDYTYVDGFYASIEIRVYP